MHLSDEQLEEALAGGGAHAEHLSACESCRRRLQSCQALRDRLRAALGSARADADLTHRVREALAQTQPGAVVPQQQRQQQDAGETPAAHEGKMPSTHAGGTPATQQDMGKMPMLRRKPLYVRLVPALAAVAAVLIIAVPLAVYLSSPNEAQAAPALLARIHEDNLVAHGGFYSESDPAKLAAYFKEKLGFTPAMPKLGKGMPMRGCCVAHFRNSAAGSYVVNTPSGPVSIIVVRDDPQSLGLKDTVVRDGKTYYLGGYARNNMATVRLGDYTYCAVAVNSVATDTLIDLLGRLVT